MSRYTGTTVTLGDSGGISDTTGNAADTSGPIDHATGTSANAGEASGATSETTGNQTHASGGASGGITKYTGNAAGVATSGGFTQYTGSQTNGGDYPSGSFLWYTGTTTTDGLTGGFTLRTGLAGAGAADAGSILFQTHGANTRLTIAGDGTNILFAPKTCWSTTAYCLVNNGDFINVEAPVGLEIIQQTDEASGDRAILKLSSLGPAEMTASSGTQYGILGLPEIDQSGTAAYVALGFDVTDSGSGSGQDYLAYLEWNNSLMFSVEDDGDTTIAGSFSSSSLSVIGAQGATMTIAERSEVLTFAGGGGDASQTTSGLVLDGETLKAIVTRVRTTGTTCTS
ncbi:unnamed protein product, partial [marine sediment metagenome]